ncbi:MAG: DUF1580 domain-containing protein, partial [Gemmataceae bacterium]|nr:DUF1580 domain-containing protein [Gemmataceae bacterium]
TILDDGIHNALAEKASPPAPSQIAAEVAQGDGLTLAQAAKLLPSKNGKRCAPTTLGRWTVNGVRLPSGATVKLEAVRLGRVTLTTKQAVERFLNRQNSGPMALVAESRPPAAPLAQTRKRQIEHARDELRDAGL